VLILLRHGRTRFNATGRLQGRIDEPLDEVGHQQAKAAAVHIGPVDELISSPLARAQQTAEAFGIPFRTDERWIELDYGVYEGEHHTAVPSDAWAHWKRDASWQPEGGESLLTLDRRVRAACEELAERAIDRTIVVVSHVSPIKSAVAWTLGVGVDMAWRSHLSHASICRIDVRRDGPVLFTFNESAVD
jgi:probable phosphoglycerate mutase